MANRIYIAVGLLAILLLTAAFVVPWFIDWNSFKPRMEQMAAEALGVEVEIAGDMDFVLLPQPQMHFENVRIGPPSDPVGSVVLAEADFSLMDFLRDRFTVTELRLSEPRLNLVVDEDGALQAPLTLAQTSTVSNVSIANARFSDGIIAISDRRSGESWATQNFTGAMQMAGLRGPFNLQGQVRYEDADYAIGFSTTAMNAQGDMQVSAQLRPLERAFTSAVDGLLRTGSSPSFTGQFTYRQFATGNGDDVVGDLLVQSPVIANAERVELTEFVVLPDDNQPTTRLTGSVAISLGETMAFDAAVSGGIVTLLPRDVSEDEARPYEIVRFLREMPQPLIPPLPGRLAMTVNELGIRGVGIREVRLDAETDGEVWAVEEFSGRLTGNTEVKLTGTLGRAAGWAAFEGTLAMASPRLDALALLWKRPMDGNPLFGMSGSLNGQLQLVNDRLRLSNGVFALEDTSHELALEMRFGDTPSLDLDLALTELDREQSAALAALPPEIDPSGLFGRSFPQGRLGLSVGRATIGGHLAQDVALDARWGAAGIAVEPLSVGDYGGIGFEGNAQIGGTLAAPRLSGSGQMSIASQARALDLVLPPAAEQHPLRTVVLESLPAQLNVVLGAPSQDGFQTATLEGQAGSAEVSIGLEMGPSGLFGLGREQVGLTVEASVDDGAALLDQLGAPPIIAGTDGAIASARLFGNPQGVLEAELSIEGGGERLSYAGDLIVSDPRSIRGNGLVDFLLADGVAIADLIGAEGVWFPPVEGEADIGIIGGESVQLSNLTAFVGDRSVTGELLYAAQREAALVTGALSFDALDVETLAAMLAGPAALIQGASGLWPDGPIDLGPTPRQTRGRIALTAPVLMAGEQRLVEALALDYAWGNEDAGLRGLFGEMGGGTIQLDATLCCASTIASKSLTGRFTLNGVDVDAILPDASAEGLAGVLTLGAQIQASGESYRDLAASLNGDGSFSIQDLVIAGLSPSAFDAAADVDDLVGIAPDDFETLVATALASGPFASNEAGSLISIIGGVARVTNVAIDGNGARLVGGGAIDLETAGLDGRWTLALTRMLAGNGLITETTGRIGLGLSGTLFAPELNLDLGPMVDSIQMRAFEIELDELEALRAEQEARTQAAAEEQARLMEEQARREAERLLLEQQQEDQTEDTQQLLDDIGALLNELEAGDETEPAPQSQAPATPSFTTLPPGALRLDLLGNPLSQSPVEGENTDGR